MKPKFEIAQDVEVFARVDALHTKYEDESQVDYTNDGKQDSDTAKSFTVSVGKRF